MGKAEIKCVGVLKLKICWFIFQITTFPIKRSSSEFIGTAIKHQKLLKFNHGSKWVFGIIWKSCLLIERFQNLGDKFEFEIINSESKEIISVYFLGVELKNKNFNLNIIHSYKFNQFTWILS